MTQDTEDVVARLHALADRQRRERGDIMYFGEHDPELSQAADLIQSLSDRIDGLEPKAVSYDHAHEDAVEMGYPSLTEALEHLEELRAAREENGQNG